MLYSYLWNGDKANRFWGGCFSGILSTASSSTDLVINSVANIA